MHSGQLQHPLVRSVATLLLCVRCNIVSTFCKAACPCKLYLNDAVVRMLRTYMYMRQQNKPHTAKFMCHWLF